MGISKASQIIWQMFLKFFLTSVVGIYDSFESNYGVKPEVNKTLNKIFWLGSD